jgi:hypothetical protein
MPLARASCGAAAGTKRRAARSAVLDDDTMLERILSSGGLRAADVAFAALVCRAWCRVAASDAVWRPVWRREAPSLRALEPRLARLAGGTGFRAAVAQLRGSALLARAPAWTLDDFSVAVDITWRGRSLLAASQPLTALNYEDEDAAEEGEAALTLPNALAQDDTDAALLLRRLRSALVQINDGGVGGVSLLRISTALRDAGVTQHLRLRLLFVRSDGAVACFLDASPCTNAGVSYHDDMLIEGLQPYWAHNHPAHLGNPPVLVFLDEHDGAAVVTWSLVLMSGMVDAQQEHGGLCRECKLCVSCERIGDGPQRPRCLFDPTRLFEVLSFL